jgi:hypothetical protein
MRDTSKPCLHSGLAWVYVRFRYDRSQFAPLRSSSLLLATPGRVFTNVHLQEEGSDYTTSSGFGRLSRLLSRAFDLTLPNRIWGEHAATRLTML